MSGAARRGGRDHNALQWCLETHLCALQALVADGDDR